MCNFLVKARQCFLKQLMQVLIKKSLICFPPRTVTGALSGDLGDLGAHGSGTANAIGLGGTAHGGGMNGLGAGAWGIKGKCRRRSCLK